MSGDYEIETPIKTAHLKLIIFEYIINLECDYIWINTILKKWKNIWFLMKVKNPYIFKVKGKLVRIRFTDTDKTAEDFLTRALEKLYR